VQASRTKQAPNLAVFFLSPFFCQQISAQNLTEKGGQEDNAKSHLTDLAFSCELLTS
jgi:hypothetical protein